MVAYYMVGGHVRDQLLGVPSKDVDLAVEAESYEEMRTAVLDRGVEVFQERPQFASIRGRDPALGVTDFTLCRRDGFYSDARRPDSVEPATIYDDLARRDFTVNAMAVSMEDGTVVDPHGGRDDLARMHLRSVGRARDRMREDPLRMLRAMRFHLVRGFSIDWEVDACLLFPSAVGGLRGVSVERAYEELERCYRHDTWATVEFLRGHDALERELFKGLRLGLRPRVEEARQ